MEIYRHGDEDEEEDDDDDGDGGDDDGGGDDDEVDNDDDDDDDGGGGGGDGDEGEEEEDNENGVDKSNWVFLLNCISCATFNIIISMHSCLSIECLQAVFVFLSLYIFCIAL